MEVGTRRPTGRLWNARRHAAKLGRRLSREAGIDPASSGRWFDGWRRVPGSREPPPAAPEEPGPSFDEFFGGDRSAPAGEAGTAPRTEQVAPTAAPSSGTAGEDIEEFNAWLRGLKR